jgi:hypothetical protein
MKSARVLAVALSASALVLTGCQSPGAYQSPSQTGSASSGSMRADLEASVGFYCMPNLCHLIIENVSNGPVEIRGDLCGKIGEKVYEGRHSVSATLNPGGKGDVDFSFLGNYADGRLSKIWLGSCEDENSAKLVWFSPEGKVNAPQANSSNNQGNTSSGAGSGLQSARPTNPSSNSQVSEEAQPEPEKGPDTADLVEAWLRSSTPVIESFATDNECTVGRRPSMQFCGLISLSLNAAENELREQGVELSGKLLPATGDPYSVFLIFKPEEAKAERSILVTNWLSSPGDSFEIEWTSWRQRGRGGELALESNAIVTFEFDPVEYSAVSGGEVYSEWQMLDRELKSSGLCASNSHSYFVGSGYEEVFRCGGSDVYDFKFSTIASVQISPTLRRIRADEMLYDFCLFGSGWFVCADHNSDAADIESLIRQSELPWLWARVNTPECQESAGCWLQN